jgi:ankyrin repeat protein
MTDADSPPSPKRHRSNDGADKTVSITAILEGPLSGYVFHSELVKKARQGDAEGVKRLLEKKDPDWNINRGDNWDTMGDSDDEDAALTVACRSQKPDVVKLLLARDDLIVGLRENAGEFPLHWAIVRAQRDEKGVADLSVARLLLADKRTIVNQVGMSGRTVLWTAVKNGWSDVIRLLIETRGPELDLDIAPPGWSSYDTYYDDEGKIRGHGCAEVFQPPLRYENGAGYSVWSGGSCKVEPITRDEKNAVLWFAREMGNVEVIQLIEHIERITVADGK